MIRGARSKAKFCVSRVLGGVGEKIWCKAVSGQWSWGPLSFYPDVLSFFLSIFPSVILSSVPSLLPSFLSFLLSFLPACLPSCLPSFGPFFLSSFLPFFLSSFLPSFFPSFAVLNLFSVSSVSMFEDCLPSGRKKERKKVCSSLTAMLISEHIPKWCMIYDLLLSSWGC